jgi:hypothetical protein
MKLITNSTGLALGVVDTNTLPSPAPPLQKKVFRGHTTLATGNCVVSSTVAIWQ